MALTMIVKIKILIIGICIFYTLLKPFRYLIQRLTMMFLITKRYFHWNEFEPRHEKTNVLVSDQVRHKPGCTATEDG